MHSLFRAFVVVLLLGCSPAMAGEKVSLGGRVVGVLQYPKTNTICMSFISTEKKEFLICDDVTSKDLIEKLFIFGKKDTDCHVEGTVSKKANNSVYLAITSVDAGK